MISSVLGLSGGELGRIELTSSLLSKTAFDSENAEPHVDGHVASQGKELRYDLPQFLGRSAVSSMGKTRFQTPSCIHILLAAILAQGDKESSSSNQNNCAAQLGSQEVNDLPVLHFVLQLFPEASSPGDPFHLIFGQPNPQVLAKGLFLAVLLRHCQLGVML